MENDTLFSLPARDCCERCGLRETCQTPGMAGRGPASKPFAAVVGDAPDEHADACGEPFQDAGGRLLRDAFADLGIDPGRVLFTHAVRCRPPGGKIKEGPAKACREFLLDELAEAAPRHVLAVGNAALRALTGERGIASKRGRWYPCDAPEGHPLAGVPVFAANPPARAIQSPALIESLAADLEEFVAVAGGRKTAGTGEPAPVDYRVVRTWEDLAAMLDGFEGAARLSWDIETAANEVAAKIPGPFDVGARVVCIQFASRTHSGWLLPIDHDDAGDELEISREDRVAVAKQLLEGPEWPPLVGQNLKYDMLFVSEVLDIWPRRPVFDTFIAQHLVDENKSVTGGNGLKAMAWAYTDRGGYEEAVERDFPNFSANMGAVPLEMLKGYACADVDVVLRVMDVLAPILAAEEMTETLALELEKQDFLADLERHGAAIDWDYNAHLVQAFPKQVERLKRGLRDWPEVQAVERALEGAKTERERGKIREEIAELRKLVAELGASAEPGAEKVINRKRRMIQAREAKLGALEAQNRGTVEFNPNSTAHLRKLYFVELELPPSDYWITGLGESSTRRQVVDEWLAELPEAAPAREIINDILRCKRGEKLLGTYVAPLAGLAGTDGRVHANYNQGRVVTFRLSSSNPNFQNLPRDDEKLAPGEVGKGDIKRQFVSPFPGGYIGEADYEQIELVIAGILSQDPVLLRCKRDGVDLHRLLASRAFPVSRDLETLVDAYLSLRGPTAAEVSEALEEEISKELRTKAKAVNFGYIYGISARAISSQHVSISFEQAKRFIAQADRLYSGFVAWANEQKRLVRSQGFTRSLFGHCRHLPHIEMADEATAAGMERQGVNFPVQCTASNLTVYAGMMANDEMKRAGLKSRICGQVHDSLWFAGPAEEREVAAALLKAVMENMPYPWLYGDDPRFPSVAPVKAEVKAGPNLRDLEVLEV